MKQKRKHILKKILIFGIAVMLASCSEELFDEAIESSNKRAIKEVRFNELYQDSKFKNLLEKVSQTSNAARTSFENQNGFTISDGFVKVIETDSVISYTMLIERDIVTDTISFENLVIQENKFNASEKAYSIKYTPTIIEPSGHDSFYYEGTEVLKNLAFTGFNRADSNAIETASNCSVYIVQTWCSKPYNGETKHHIAGADCDVSTQYYKFVSIISPDDCDGSSSSGSSGSNNNNAPQEPPGPGNTGGITSPVKPTPTPCPGDPVKNPKICPSSPGNIKGGTYGCTRKANTVCDGVLGKKKHGGVDVVLPLFETISTMYSGTVVAKRTNFEYNQYAANSFGNFVEIESVINGEIIRIKYCHLGYVAPEVTGYISQGFPFALSGKSGNAAREGVTPHLHLQAKKKVGDNWVEIDPLPLFDTNFNPTTFKPNGTKSNCN